MYFTIELAAKDNNILEVAGYLESDNADEVEFIKNFHKEITSLPELQGNHEIATRFVLKGDKLIINQIEIKALCVIFNLINHNDGLKTEVRFTKNCRFLPSDDIKPLLSMRFNQLLE